MSIKNRREEEKEIVKRKIIDAARTILIEQGYDKLSIRKIAKQIDYSPGIIYHYFQDKADIVTQVVEEGYGQIVTVLGKVPINQDHPEESIISSLRAYIDLMLSMPEQFRALMMNNIEGLQEKVNILNDGISEYRTSIQGVCRLLELGVQKGTIRDIERELTAQIIWTSTFGLLSRIILEKEISSNQKKRLIDHHFDILLNGIKKK